MIDHDRFDEQIDKHFRSTHRIAVFLFIVGVLAFVGVSAGVAYIVAHFLQKVW